MSFLESKHCTSRFNCTAFCLVNEQWRKQFDAPDICPFGVTLETAPALLEQSIAKHNKPISPCRHLGSDTLRRVECPSCEGTVKLKVFACFVHGQCTQGGKIDGIACCAGCVDYSNAPKNPDLTPLM